MAALPAALQKGAVLGGPTVGVPRISFAVASYNAGAFLRAAVASALAQRGVAVEVLIVDDHSADGSDAIGWELAAADPRVTFLRTPRNSGPAGARNVALDHARGEWFAILDSDDLLHPDRSARLLAEAETSAADMIADDLLLFDEDRAVPCRLFLDAGRAAGAQWIALPDYLDETRMYGRRPNLGFLKPMIRRDFLVKHAIRYDEALRVAEDDALILACLGVDARYRLLPRPLYFYRKHGGSISHRLQTAHADRMKEASDRLLAAPALNSPATRMPLRRRAAAMRRAWAFTHLIEALRARRPARALGMLAAHPGAAVLLHMPIAGLWRKLVPGRRSPALAPFEQEGVLLLGGAGARFADTADGRGTGRRLHLVAPADGGAWSRDDVRTVADASLRRPRAVVVGEGDAGELRPYLLDPDLPIFVAGPDVAPARIAEWLAAGPARPAMAVVDSAAPR